MWASPATSACDLLLRRAAQRHVRQVMVNGEWVVRDGQSTRIDEAAVAAALRAELAAYDPQLLADNAAAARALAPYLRRFYAVWDG